MLCWPFLKAAADELTLHLSWPYSKEPNRLSGLERLSRQIPVLDEGQSKAVQQGYKGCNFQDGRKTLHWFQIQSHLGLYILEIQLNIPMYKAQLKNENKGPQGQKSLIHLNSHKRP